MRTVELELDDVTYIGEYTYSKPRAATRWEPSEGGVYFDRVTVLLDGYDGPIEVDVTAHVDSLAVMDQLYQMAHEQEKEICYG